MSNVYTVIGEHGNYSGPYTAELPSLAAALEAIDSGNFPLLRLSAIPEQETAGTAAMHAAQWYCIVEHPPRVKVDAHTYRGGVHDGVRAYDYDGNVGAYGSARRTMDADVPAEWAAYRERIARRAQ